MTVDGVIGTGLVAVTGIYMGFGMMRMVERNMGQLIKDGKKQRPLERGVAKRPQRSEFFNPNFNYKPMSKVSNAKQYYSGYRF